MLGTCAGLVDNTGDCTGDGDLTAALPGGGAGVRGDAAGTLVGDPDTGDGAGELVRLVSG